MLVLLLLVLRNRKRKIARTCRQNPACKAEPPSRAPQSAKSSQKGQRKLSFLPLSFIGARRSRATARRGVSRSRFCSQSHFAIKNERLLVLSDKTPRLRNPAGVPHNRKGASRSWFCSCSTALGNNDCLGCFADKTPRLRGKPAAGCPQQNPATKSHESRAKRGSKSPLPLFRGRGLRSTTSLHKSKPGGGGLLKIA